MSDLTQRYCTFHLGDLFFGVPVEAVQEMILTSVRTEVPLVSPVVAGLVNLRGEIVTTIDLRRRIGQPPAEVVEGKDDINMVIRTSDTVVSLIVDAIDDVVTVNRRDWESVPPTLTDPCRELVSGVYKLEGKLMLTLDLERLLDFPVMAEAVAAV